MKTPQHVSGKRWFQKTYGNTYHTTEIFFSDGTSEKSDRSYGYGDQYLQTAYEMLSIDKYEGTRGLREMGATYAVADVERQKDL